VIDYKIARQRALQKTVACLRQASRTSFRQSICSLLVPGVFVSDRARQRNAREKIVPGGWCFLPVATGGVLRRHAELAAFSQQG
jgi:hypothetical protein